MTSEAKAAAPAVSIIMPAYKTAAYIAESIDSVLRQTFADWELLIVDDGSPDTVLEIVEPYRADPRIRVHSFENGGLATARNRGLALARGEFVSLLDSDDLFEPTYLEEMLGAFARDPGVTFVTCDALMFGIPNREGTRFAQYEPQVPPLTLERVLAREFNVFVASTLRTADLRDAGGFDASLRSAEDFDLWTRLLAHGKRGGLIARPLVRYRRRADSLSAATATLMAYGARVYASRLVELPLDSPASAICRAKLAECVDAIDFAVAEDAMARGDLKTAMALLERGQANPPLRWRLLRALMRHAPGLAARIVTRRQAKQAAELSRAPS